MNRLPPTFMSLYRLVLRSTSASVLHHTVARKNLCKLWRPAFDAAARVVRELQTHQLSQMQRTKRERLLNIFQLRVDATLNLLLNSANSRGIPHQVVRNLNLLRKRHIDWVHGGYYSQLSKNAWKPQLSPKAPEYSPKSLIPESQRATVIQARRRKNKQADERCWNALGEVVRMAEGRHNMSLGRVRLKPWAMERS
ncbi:hypothetical protein PAXRUDRAFT_826056 [Paxillus rubicundulus Ve08.2h10]|uniref:Uncharacterized protein n=1 Tax=Paxillus rubicundulus Ve08.2h10 TaxID=930991 RepID=A0A0D0E4W8_9AGAM|nr:hypothetical protein PAXRUDRAFT_826056 [Paxillus rubicundulus Ve08.2h10]